MTDMFAIPCGRCGGPSTTTEREVREGPFADIAARLARCERCADLDAQDAAAEEEADRERERRQCADRLLRRRAVSGIPEALQAITFDRLPDVPAQVVDDARRWSASHLRGVLLEGTVGVGKTWTAAAALWAMTERRPGRWESAPALLANLGLGFGNRAHDEAVGTLASSSPLVLDDLDKVRPTEYGAEQVYVAIDGRVTAGAPLLVTTNLPLDDLACRWPQPYGEAIASRLHGYCVRHSIAGHDLRSAAVS